MCRVGKVRRVGIKRLELDDAFILWGLFWYTILCVAFNQIATGAGSNLMTPEEEAALTPKSTAERVRGSKWVFVSEHAMLLTIWSMKAAMLVLYARVTEGLRQRKMLNGVIVWVCCGFLGDELALFLICRPLSQYWAVPPADCKRKLSLGISYLLLIRPQLNAPATNTTRSSTRYLISLPTC